jgi:signal transduction histidine kinase
MTTPDGIRLVSDAGLVEEHDATPARTLGRIAHLAALATRATIAQINLLTNDRRTPIAVHVDATRIAAANAVMDAAWRDVIDVGGGDDALHLGDAESVAVADVADVAVAGDRVRSYAAARLRTPAGVVLGTVCVADYAPREWSSAERAALAECAALAGEELAAQLSTVAAERSRIEAERAQNDAEIASRAKSEFLAVLSRELRGQLDTLGGYAARLELDVRRSPMDDRRDELRRVQLGQRHLVSLVDDILRYSNLEQGLVTFALTPVGIREALAEAEAAVATQARAKAILLRVGDLRDDVFVLADVAKTREILTKLLSNAVEFTGAGGRIDVTCDVTRTDVRLRVRDTGIGIPADRLDVIFEPFVHLRADLARTVEDAGLGLAISRALARGQGGDLTVESTVGAGSTFTLTLPRAKKSS